MRKPLRLSRRDELRNWLLHGWWPELEPGFYDCRNFPKDLELATAQLWEDYNFRCNLKGKD